MSFASEPGRDDGNLPPLNIVIPDDARELDRDVLAYRRELRARRRQQRITRLFRPFTRRELGGHAAILPLIATCVALAMLAGAMLSVITISPASGPTVAQTPSASSGPVTRPSASSGVATEAAGLTTLPDGDVQLPDGRTIRVRSLTSSALALVTPGCGCDLELSRLAGQAAAVHAVLYFVGSGPVMPVLADLTAQYGRGVARPLYDTRDVLGAAYHPVGLTLLLVYSDATARVHQNLRGGFQLGPDLRELTLPGSRAS